jgi:hypothetical protein
MVRLAILHILLSTPPRVFRYPPRMETFDPEHTAQLAALIETPAEQRDEAWCDKVLSAAPNASLKGFSPQIEIGPDTFPYFQLAIPDGGDFAPASIVQVLDQAIAAGAGVVIHTNTRRDEQPLWVFSFGDILSYAMFQDFKGDPKVYLDNTPPDPNDPALLRAAPSESYFPTSARVAMDRFMRGPFHHPNPKIGLVTGASLQPRQNLIVNLGQKDYDGDAKKLDAAMSFLLWFIPKSYALIALPDDWTDDGMTPLNAH